MLAPTNDEKMDIVRELVSTDKFTFYLTGSRYFEVERNDSDWDFFTEDEEEVRKYLENLGFVSEKEAYNIPPLQEVVMVYRYYPRYIRNDLDSMRTSQKKQYGYVDVQLVLDPLKKDKIQYILRGCGKFRPELEDWNSMYMLLNSNNS